MTLGNPLKLKQLVAQLKSGSVALLILMQIQDMTMNDTHSSLFSSQEYCCDGKPVWNVMAIVKKP
jgi:hypothetical protein